MGSNLEAADPVGVAEGTLDIQAVVETGVDTLGNQAVVLEGNPEGRVHIQGKDRVDKALSWHLCVRCKEYYRVLPRTDLAVVVVSPCKDYERDQLWLKWMLGLRRKGLRKGLL